MGTQLVILDILYLTVDLLKEKNLILELLVSKHLLVNRATQLQQ